MKHLLTILLVVFLMACNSNVNEPVTELKELKYKMILLERTETLDKIYLVTLETTLEIEYILIDNESISIANPFFLVNKPKANIFVKFSNNTTYKGIVLFR